MHVWVVEEGDLKLWRRSGECRQCGECCCGSEINYTSSIGAMGGSVQPGEEEEVEDWSEWAGYAIFKAQGVWWYFRVNGIDTDAGCHCGSLVDGRCAEWQDPMEFKPVCRYWPFHPLWAHHYPDCGFAFERVE
jgi:hypothetical protein